MDLKIDFDNDLKFQQAQSVCAAEMINIIAYGCVSHYESALRIIGKYDFELEKSVTKVRFGYDQNSLRKTHDLLAKYWRLKNNRNEPFFEGLEPNTINDWKTWLKNEVSQWAVFAPEIVRYICVILIDENMSQKRDAEMALLVALKCRYS